MKTRTILGLVIMIGAGVLAWRIGERMSVEAMAIAVGVVMGVAATIPTSIIIMWAADRRTEPPPRPEPPLPPQIVIWPAANGHAPQLPAAPEWPVPPDEMGGNGRRYTLIDAAAGPGGDEWV